jgi:hypothetical protein
LTRLLYIGREPENVDLYQVIGELREEKKRLDRLIAALEAIKNDQPKEKAASVSRRRGRKSMSENERREVSERMKRYWAARRDSANREKISAVTS